MHLTLVSLDCVLDLGVCIAFVVEDVVFVVAVDEEAKAK